MKMAPKIGVWQLFSIVLLSRLLTFLTYSPVADNQMRSTDFFASAVLTVLFTVLFSIPLFVQQRMCPRQDIVDVAYSVKPWLSKATSVCYALCFLVFSVTTLAKLELFVATIVFPNNDSTLFVVFFVAAACYAAYLGLEGIGRAGSISLMVFFAAFALILLAMLGKLRLTNFAPFFTNGVMPTFWNGLDAASRTVEIAILAILMPRVQGKVSKAYSAFLITYFVFSCLVCFFVFGGLGDYALTQIFPIHAGAVLSEFSVFQRFDVLLTGVWILSAYIKISLLLYLQTELLQKSFSRKGKNWYILASGLLLLCSQLFVVGRARDYFFAVSRVQRFVAYFIFVVVLPGLILALYAIKRRKSNEKVH